MELDLFRTKATRFSWSGKLAINGVFECFTLERSPIDPDFKPIPKGRYEVAVYMSPKFQQLIPHILNVPGRDAIEIHMGNCPQDSHGCVLVGRQLGDDEIYSSKVALSMLLDKLEKVTERIYINIGGENEKTTV